VTSVESLLGGEAFEAAPRLLGLRLVSDVDGERTAVTLVEVEAYGGADDPASHAHRGPTARNAAMYGPAGTLYVYRSYGIHWCANVVCRPAGTPSAVLLRGGVVVDGGDVVRRRRGRSDHLCDGPGRLAQALAITGDHNGTSVFDGPLRIEGAAAPGVVVATPRVGITRAVERPWRFIFVPEPVDNPRA